MINEIPLINGSAYSWADITIIVAGMPVLGVKAIDYEDDEKIEDIHGAGNRTVARGRGEIKTAGSITLMVDEIEALSTRSITGRLQDLGVFPIIVNYLNTSGKMITHTLKYCQFKKNARKAKQGDTSLEMELPLVIGGIDWK